MGRAAQELLGSLDQGLELAQGTTSFVWAGDRIVRGWAIELLLIGAARPVPRRRRRPLRALPAARHPARSRGAQPAQPPRLLALRRARLLRVPRARRLARRATARPPSPASATAGDWPVARADRRSASSRSLGWIVARQRLVPRRPVGAGRAARRRDGRAARARCRCVARSGNKPVRADLHPARRCTPGSGCRRCEAATRRRASLVFVIGLAGPARAARARSRVRYGLGFDAPWYLARARRGRLRARRRRRDRARLDRVRARSSPPSAAGRYAPVPAGVASGRRAARCASSCARSC